MLMKKSRKKEICINIFRIVKPCSVKDQRLGEGMLLELNQFVADPKTSSFGGGTR